MYSLQSLNHLFAPLTATMASSGEVGKMERSAMGVERQGTPNLSRSTSRVHGAQV